MNLETTPLSPSASRGPATIRRPWLLLARLAWIAVAILLLVVSGILMSRGARLLLLEDNVSDSFAALSGLMTYNEYVRIILVARYLVLGIYWLTAAFIFWRKSHEIIGLASSTLLLIFPFFFNLAGQVPDSNLTVFTPDIDRILNGSWALISLGIAAVFFVLFLFPNGRSVGRRVTIAAWTMGLMFLALASLAATGLSVAGVLLSEALGPPASMLLIGLLVLGLGAQVYRYRRLSTPTERQQTRWVLAALMFTLLWAITIGSWDPFRSYERWAALYALVRIFGGVVVAALLPLAFARAIVSHHLWGIDVIIRRTLVYGLLTGALLLIYLSSILILQSLFTRLIGNDSTLATILSTLLIAALFLPLRRRIQELIDRRFYRRKYDAAQVLERFSATARDETDLDMLAAELLRVINDTMQPTHASLWLRAGGNRGTGRPTADNSSRAADG